MRIISGKFKGRKFDPPEGLGVRPTTDRAREALFNILIHRYDLENRSLLDLFAGSGGVSFEFLSRGGRRVICIDKNRRCIQYIEHTLKEWKIENFQTHVIDAKTYLEQFTETVDFVFLDPPYMLAEKIKLIEILLEKNILEKEGCVILEHPATENFEKNPFFKETRVYGASAFSFFSYANEKA